MEVYQPLTASISIPYEHKARFGMLRTVCLWFVRGSDALRQSSREKAGSRFIEPRVPPRSEHGRDIKRF
jgi:hypothetical protein